MSVWGGPHTHVEADITDLELDPHFHLSGGNASGEDVVDGGNASTTTFTASYDGGDA